MNTNLDGYQDEPLRQLIEDAHQLQELTQHPGWAVLTRLAEQNIDGWQGRMNSGNFKSLEEYKFCAGWLEGARKLLSGPMDAQEELARVRQRLEEETKLMSEVEDEVRREYPDLIDLGATT